MLSKISREIFVRTHRFWGFLEENALAINDARMRHLASLELPIEGRSVLEVGAGIGLLTSFFEQRGCRVLTTDARPENVAEIRRRFPKRRTAVVDLEHPEQVDALGRFDIVFCYGTLYHLAAPEPALQAMSRVSDMILLETCLSPGHQDDSPNVAEELTHNQAFSGVGSRPTRRWVMERLRRCWGHGYLSVTQPAHPDFPIDWTVPSTTPNVRAIFVGSRTPLANPHLTTEIPDRQPRF